MRGHLVFFLDELYHRVGRAYYGRFSTLLFVRELARHFDSITLFLTVRRADAAAAPFVAELPEARVKVVALPPYGSLAGSVLHLPRTLAVFWRHRRMIQEARAVFIRLPSLAGLALGELSRGLGKKPWYHICANIETQANPLSRKGAAGVLWRGLARLLNALQQAAARGLDISAVGAELAGRFRRGLPLVRRPRRVVNLFESLVDENRFYRREDTCQGEEITVLRVCQVEPSRGLEVLLQAVRRVRERGLPVRLEVVGWAEPAYARRLKALADSLGLGGRVTFSGPLTYDDLWRRYRAADLQVISSYGEGLPRVILEGWGACLPLVSTAVGGIPALVQDGDSGLLTPPGDPEALAGAIARMIEDGALRRRIIATGFARVQEFSLERQAARLAELLTTG